LLRVGIRVDPEIVVVGSAAAIFVTLKNPLPRSVEVSSCPLTYFWIQNKQGEVVAGSRAVYCALVGSSLIYNPIRLKPFESRTFEYTWSGAETQSVPLGQYLAYGWFNDAEHASAPAQISVVVTAAP
jgi:hypothetical protein